MQLTAGSVYSHTVSNAAAARPSRSTVTQVSRAPDGYSSVEAYDAERLIPDEQGFAELEYGILCWMGAVDKDTPVVTTIHDCQLLDEDIDSDKMLEHDVPVDIIITPTQVIRTHTKLPRPSGILWHKLSPQKLGQIRVLRELKQRIEEETGQQVCVGQAASTDLCEVWTVSYALGVLDQAE